MDSRVKGILTSLNLDRADAINESNGIDGKDAVLIDQIISALARKHGNDFMSQGDNIVNITKAKDGVSFNIQTVTGDMPDAEGHFLTTADLEGKTVNEAKDKDDDKEDDDKDKDKKKKDDEDEDEDEKDVSEAKDDDDEEDKKKKDKKKKEDEDDEEEDEDEEDKKKNESVQSIIAELKAKHSKVDEETKFVVTSGISTSHKQTLQKIQEKASKSKKVSITKKDVNILEDILREVDAPISVLESLRNKSLSKVVNYLKENHKHLFNNSPELSESQKDLMKNFQLVMEGIKKEAELDGKFGNWFEGEILGNS